MMYNILQLACTYCLFHNTFACLLDMKTSFVPFYCAEEGEPTLGLKAINLRIISTVKSPVKSMLRMFMASLKFLVWPWCCKDTPTIYECPQRKGCFKKVDVPTLNFPTWRSHSPAWPDRWCWEGWGWTSGTQSRWSWPRTTPCTGKGSWGCSDATGAPSKRTPHTDAVTHTHRQERERRRGFNLLQVLWLHSMSSLFVYNSACQLDGSGWLIHLADLW